ncbi:pilin [Pseudomonas sp. NPDC007930]|uniref:pilin n=1 Tax=Pseudomonas sp. NPDC007930 TaxID=3364417 RepID=UPI0036E65EA9
MKTRTSGFSLIELMIAVAIIGILASIAIPLFTQFLAKSKISAGLSEIGALRAGVQDAIENNEISNPTLSQIGAPSNSTNCSLALTVQSGITTLSCTLVNPPSSISGGVVSYIRSAGGAWTCQMNSAIAASYVPSGCVRGN